MHTYSTDNDNRPTVYGILGFAAHAAALAVGWLSTTLSAVIPSSRGHYDLLGSGIYPPYSDV